jgi:hypothetical protein
LLREIGHPVVRIKPGTFLTLAGGRLEPLEGANDDTPYDGIAFDRVNDAGLSNFAWMGPMSLDRIGRPRLDRVADLSRMVMTRISWAQRHPRHRSTGRLKSGEQARSMIQTPGGNWTTNVSDPAKTIGHDFFPLSTFGQLMCLGALLHEKALALLKSEHLAHQLGSLSRIAQEPGHPLEWPPARASDLDEIPAELLRLSSQLPDAEALASFEVASDFGCVKFEGQTYVFSGNARKVIGVLFEAARLGDSGVSVATIGTKIGSEAARFRLDSCFREKANKRNPGYSVLVELIGSRGEQRARIRPVVAMKWRSKSPVAHH